MACPRCATRRLNRVGCHLSDSREVELLCYKPIVAGMVWELRAILGISFGCESHANDPKCHCGRFGSILVWAQVAGLLRPLAHRFPAPGTLYEAAAPALDLTTNEHAGQYAHSRPASTVA